MGTNRGLLYWRCLGEEAAEMAQESSLESHWLPPVGGVFLPVNLGPLSHPIVKNGWTQSLAKDEELGIEAAQMVQASNQEIHLVAPLEVSLANWHSQSLRRATAPSNAPLVPVF